MRYLVTGLILAIMMASPYSLAEDLHSQLVNYFQQRLAGVSNDVSVEIKSDPAHSLTCDAPAFSTPGNSRLWGNMSVMMRCGNDKRFVQVAVSATGEYIVATRTLPRGSTLSAESLTLKRGRLDRLPSHAITALDSAIGAVTLRDILPDIPLTGSMVRQPWRVRGGTQVRVIAQGEGFSINSEGRALNNAAAGQAARVRMTSGQIVTGTVDSQGNVVINLSSS